MSDITADRVAVPLGGPDLNRGVGRSGAFVFIALLLLGLGYTASGLVNAIDDAGGPPLAFGVFALLGVALLIALGFEFVNGFHDTANAVATVIYTHSLPAHVAVIYSGTMNFIGVLRSSGGVAFAIVTLLPVELILRVGGSAGFSMIFALLIAAVIWNLATWAFGIPNSSSHTLIGSVVGVGLANQFMAEPGSGVSSIDWSQLEKVGEALLFSPLIGFIGSAVLLLLLKLLVRAPELYRSPEGSAPPPLWIRGLLILTCGSVSYAHGSNDGQKGMGLIMLILIGSVPTAFALNRAVPDSQVPAFIASTHAVQQAMEQGAGGPAPDLDAARSRLEEALKTRQVGTPDVFGAVATVAGDIGGQVQRSGSLNHVPAASVQNIRNEMFAVDEALRQMQKQHVTLPEGADAAVKDYRSQLDNSTKFIPRWVKVAVAVALGLGTMVGWKRIVVTVGEKIGKQHLTYGQGASAELVAAATILAADTFNLPVSTTHVLTSGVAGTMAANGSGLDWGTVRNLLMAWVLTLPMAILLSGSLYWLFRTVSGG